MPMRGVDGTRTPALTWPRCDLWRGHFRWQLPLVDAGESVTREAASWSTEASGMKSRSLPVGGVGSGKFTHRPSQSEGRPRSPAEARFLRPRRQSTGGGSNGTDSAPLGSLEQWPRVNSKTLSGRNDMAPLILKRGAVSRPSGKWPDDDYDVLENGVVVGSIFSRRSRAVGSALDVIEWPQRRAARRIDASQRARLRWLHSRRVGGVRSQNRRGLE